MNSDDFLDLLDDLNQLLTPLADPESAASREDIVKALRKAVDLISSACDEIEAEEDEDEDEEDEEEDEEPDSFDEPEQQEHYWWS